LRNDSGPQALESDDDRRLPRSIQRDKGDARLKPFADLMPASFWGAIYDAMRFGSAFDPAPIIGALLSSFSILGVHSELIEEMPFNPSGAAQLAEDGDYPVPGSAEYSILKCNPEHLQVCRRLIRVLRRAFLASPRLADIWFPSLTQVAKATRVAGESIAYHPWNLFVFVLFLHGTRSTPVVHETVDQYEMLLEHLLNGDPSGVTSLASKLSGIGMAGAIPALASAKAATPNQSAAAHSERSRDATPR
jgi:hypothetical protein